MIDSESWRTDALCLTEGDPSLWFPGEGPSSPEFPPSALEAIAICNRCPVRETCLALAMENRERYGIWGGLTVKQRWSILRKRTRGTKAGASPICACGGPKEKRAKRCIKCARPNSQTKSEAKEVAA